MSIEEKLNRVSQLLEKMLLHLEVRNFSTIEKKQNIIDHPTSKLMEQFIEGIKSLKWLNEKIEKNETPYYMGYKEVKRITGLSLSTLNRMQESGKFPSKRKIGDSTVRWLSTDIYEWMNSREKVFNMEIKNEEKK